MESKEASRHANIMPHLHFKLLKDLLMLNNFGKEKHGVGCSDELQLFGPGWRWIVVYHQ